MTWHVRRVRDGGKEPVAWPSGLPVPIFLARLTHLANKWSTPVQNDTCLERLIMCSMPDSAIAETYRKLRTNLSRTIEQGGKKILFVSPWGSDGKSMVTANVAASFAQIGKKVVLIDGDLRRPTLSYLFGAGKTEGFSNVLGRGGSVLPYVQDTNLPKLSILPSGTFIAKPADIMSGPRIRIMMSELHEAFDCILIDSAPMTFFAEGSLLATHSDGVVIVLNPKRWRGEEELDVKRHLEEAKANIVGIVLNGDEEGANAGSYYYYGSYYKYYSKQKKGFKGFWPFRRK